MRIDRAGLEQQYRSRSPLMNRQSGQLARVHDFKFSQPVAGLQEGIAQNLHVFCNGGAISTATFIIAMKHGSVDIHSAIPMSCDPFYYAGRQAGRQSHLQIR